MESIIINNNEHNNEHNNKYNKIKDIDNIFIIKLLQSFIYTHKPIFKESFNDGYPTEDTYIIEIKTRGKPRIIEVLNMLEFKNESYLSYDEKEIHGLSYKSYAFYKECKINNCVTQFVFCLDTDKACKGILLSSKFN